MQTVSDMIVQCGSCYRFTSVACHVMADADWRATLYVLCSAV